MKLLLICKINPIKSLMRNFCYWFNEFELSFAKKTPFLPSLVTMNSEYVFGHRLWNKDLCLELPLRGLTSFNLLWLRNCSMYLFLLRKLWKKTKLCLKRHCCRGDRNSFSQSACSKTLLFVLPRKSWLVATSCNFSDLNWNWWRKFFICYILVYGMLICVKMLKF